MPEKVLVAGNNVRNVAESAKKAGYKVFALTKFADSDLKIYCEKVYRIFEEDERELKSRIEFLAESLNAKVVLCSGFETLDVNAEILGSNPKECEKVTDKLKFYRILEKAGIPHPELLKGDEGVKAILKPRRGGGGEEIEFYRGLEKDNFIVQRFIEGIPCSVSLLVSREPYPVACNLILAGWKEMNASGFRYCGNITPLNVDEETRKKLEEAAVETVSLFDLRGSVGVDFILADKPYVLEINPRFQGSLDSIEWSYDVNLFKLHVVACNEGKVGFTKPKRFAGRAILFTNREIYIKRDLSGNPFFADVPNVGDRYCADDPLISILSSGRSLKKVKEKIIERKNIGQSLLS